MGGDKSNAKNKDKDVEMKDTQEATSSSTTRYCRWCFTASQQQVKKYQSLGYIAAFLPASSPTLKHHQRNPTMVSTTRRCRRMTV